jgi:hypothetical protein
MYFVTGSFPRINLSAATYLPIRFMEKRICRNIRIYAKAKQGTVGPNMFTGREDGIWCFKQHCHGSSLQESLWCELHHTAARASQIFQYKYTITRRTDTNGNPLAVFLLDSWQPKQNIKSILLSHYTDFPS